MGGLCIVLAFVMKYVLVRENKKIYEMEQSGTLESSVTTGRAKDQEGRKLAGREFKYLY